LRILGLDVATTTGYALYDPAAPVSAIKAGKFRCAGDNAEEKAASLVLFLHGLIGGMEVNIVFEEPLRRALTYKTAKGEGINSKPAMQLTGLSCAVAAFAALGGYKWRSVPINSWRRAFYGAGGHKGWTRADWKRAALARCQMLNIKVPNNDAAEAVGIAICGAGLFAIV